MKIAITDERGHQVEVEVHQDFVVLIVPLGGCECSAERRNHQEIRLQTHQGFSEKETVSTEQAQALYHSFEKIVEETLEEFAGKLGKHTKKQKLLDNPLRTPSETGFKNSNIKEDI